MCSVHWCNLLIFILVLTLNDVSARNPRKIVGGSDGRIEDYPYMVQITMSNGLHRCGGTLISNKHVLTGAHCVTDAKNDELVLSPPSSFRVIPGQATLDSDDGERYHVARIDVHMDWDGEFADDDTGGDIAILTLADKIPGITQKKVAKLPSAPAKPGDEGTIIGWGRTEDSKDSPLSSRLQTAEMTVISYKLCRARHDPWIPKDALCSLANDLNISFCAGDSGGPFMNKNGEVFAIISYNWGCSGKDANIFTSVFYYKSWIEEILQGIDSADTKVF